MEIGGLRMGCILLVEQSLGPLGVKNPK